MTSRGYPYHRISHYCDLWETEEREEEVGKEEVIQLTKPELVKALDKWQEKTQNSEVYPVSKLLEELNKILRKKQE